MPEAGFHACRVVLFDAYGTLFELASIEEGCASLLAGSGAPDPASVAALWRAKQLEYSLHRSLMGPTAWADFHQVTREALDYTLARVGLAASEATRADLLALWERPRPDPAAAAVLAALAPRPRAILSNGTAGMLATTVTAAGLAPHLDAVLSVDAVRVYKPAPQVYALGSAHFGVTPAEVCFVSANAWDAVGAATFGFRVCWVNRSGWPADRHGPPPAAIIASLADLPALIAAPAPPSPRPA